MKFKMLKILLFNCSLPPLFFFSFPVGISLSRFRGEHRLILFWEQCANSSCNNSSVGGGGGGSGSAVAVVVAVAAAAVVVVVVVVW
jgi:hypothetical protein